MATGQRTEPPAPSADMVSASRRHLNEQYARGVERLLWELEKHPMPDVDAVRAVIAAVRSGEGQDALDIGAALVLLQAMRLELDCLESDVFGVARERGLDDESLAAVLDLPDAAAAQARREFLDSRRELPRTAGPSALAGPPAPADTADGMSRAAAAASRRAATAGQRAEAAARRRNELSQSRHEDPGSPGADPEPAAAHAGQARVEAGEAAERVALGLLRAATALERCADTCLDHSAASASPDLRQRSEEYVEAAQRYREMAARYRGIGGSG
jgi:hypothetical protein